MPALSPEVSAEGFRFSGRFLQSPFWGRFKASQGWRENWFLIDGVYCLTLTRRLPFFGSLAYVPLGPDTDVLPGERSAFLAAVTEGMKPFLPPDLLCIRFDPPWEKISASAPEAPGFPEPVFPAPPVRKSRTDIQPPDTVILDLSLTEEELLGGMKPKWRYNIRLSEKKGVAVRRGGSADMAVFYELYRETALRDGIAIHDREYYESLLKDSAALGSGEPGAYLREPLISLYIAEFEGKPLAAIITLFSGFEAVYLYGASSNSHRNLMPAYLLQWTAIRDAREYGARWYDFYGIPPTDDEDHPMHGLYRFKTGFGGRIVHRTGSLDVPAGKFPGGKLRYAAYILAENARLFWFKKVKKLLIRRQ
jgi:lipid II:glycine glycyltransferase (peptidoglycan interpeptide bridge formation enzyme)